jgi:protein O-GlcNAc transferase
MNINKTIQLAVQHYHSGNLRETELFLKKALKIKPHDAEILHFLGIVYAQLNFDDLAIQSFKKTLHINPTNVDTLLVLGILLQRKGLIDEAISYFQKTIALSPNNVEAHKNIGNALTEKGQIDEAMIYYQKAIQISPLDADIYHNLAMSLQAKELLDDSIKYYRKAIQINPNLPKTYNNLGLVFQSKGQIDEAITCYQKAIMIDPNFAEAYYQLGNVQEWIGKHEEALSAFDKAIKIQPNLVIARWARCISQLPMVYQDQSGITESRKLYHKGLIELIKTIPLETPQDIKDAAEAIGIKQPFHLAHQGLNDRELQQIYGNFICKIMALRYPQFAKSPHMSQRLQGAPLRIGIVSGFFYWHAIWKIPLRGWVENIDRNRFSLYGYYTGKVKDYTTEDAKQYFNRFVEDIYSFEQLCQIIQDDSLHVLLYPEIGMDPMTVRLAALKLAPIQCTTLGHPDTSGLPTIDYYLSSELMEPSDAEEHYTEKLIRLPKLSIYYTELNIKPAVIDRSTYGLRHDSILYLCCHQLPTHLPQYDDIYPRIAKEVKDCQFLFISYRNTSVTEQFRQRIGQAFSRFNLNSEEYVVFLPYLDPEHYCAINNLSDIFLDTIGWSANNSTFEAIACNLPVVTFPGTLMRQRHCSAILTMMGMTETIASTLPEYIELAVRLGLDPEWRKQISEKIAANKHLVYRDKTCITALEDFLERVVKEKLP